jgi:hypothetical protein
MEAVNECSICFDGIQKNAKDNFQPVFLTCLHLFHQKCISEWLDRRNICPICLTVQPVPSKRAKEIGEKANEQISKTNVMPLSPHPKTNIEEINESLIRGYDLLVKSGIIESNYMRDYDKKPGKEPISKHEMQSPPQDALSEYLIRSGKLDKEGRCIPPSFKEDEATKVMDMSPPEYSIGSSLPRSILYPPFMGYDMPRRPEENIVAFPDPFHTSSAINVMNQVSYRDKSNDNLFYCQRQSGMQYGKADDSFEQMNKHLFHVGSLGYKPDDPFKFSFENCEFVSKDTVSLPKETPQSFEERESVYSKRLNAHVSNLNEAKNPDNKIIGTNLFELNAHVTNAIGERLVPALGGQLSNPYNQVWRNPKPVTMRYNPETRSDEEFSID